MPGKSLLALAVLIVLLTPRGSQCAAATGGVPEVPKAVSSGSSTYGGKYGRPCIPTRPQPRIGVSGSPPRRAGSWDKKGVPGRDYPLPPESPQYGG
ncbi:hypothetical protein MLD38_011443 [Melastoma candidum]|uniref:Uncharacterized protein n=1 Tax=Melastoma candidum TaxID=119954 RepID=A0ACB9R4E8_9MYRT|nr:hypothetical protein MLD38_011443 [Melastoma candidum]